MEYNICDSLRTKKPNFAHKFYNTGAIPLLNRNNDFIDFNKAPYIKLLNYVLSHAMYCNYLGYRRDAGKIDFISEKVYTQRSKVYSNSRAI